MRQTNVPRLTIGIEEEFQIVDGDGQLKSGARTLLSAARPHLGEHITQRVMQSSSRQSLSLRHIRGAR